MQQINSNLPLQFNIPLLSPIVLFVYNRPWHTEQTLTALMKCDMADQSTLYIYADGPKENASEEQLKNIKEVRQIIRSKNWCKEIQIIESERNKGLADSVINSTSEIVNSYGKVITLEDDVIVGKFFLRFMNEGLSLYESAANVFMISGYNFPVPEYSKKHRSFFLPIGTTQAWGTWKREWGIFDKEAKGYEKLKEDGVLRKKFNLDNSYDFAAMLEAQMETDIISSWGIRFRWSLFQNNGLILFPDRSLIKNIGWDGSGRHCNNNNPYEDYRWDPEYPVSRFPAKIKTDKKKLQKLKKYLSDIANPNKISIKNRILGILISIKHKLF